MKIIEIFESPIALDLARQHLRVGSATHDDTLIAAKLDMAYTQESERTVALFGDALAAAVEKFVARNFKSVLP